MKLEDFEIGKEYDVQYIGEWVKAIAVKPEWSKSIIFDIEGELVAADLIDKVKRKL